MSEIKTILEKIQQKPDAELAEEMRTAAGRFSEYLKTSKYSTSESLAAIDTAVGVLTFCAEQTNSAVTTVEVGAWKVTVEKIRK